MTKAELLKRVCFALCRADYGPKPDYEKPMVAGGVLWETYIDCAQEVIRSLHYAPGVQITYTGECDG